MFKSGFIMIIGETNVGKSTLLNALINQKVSITSSKPQTTRKQIMGICNNDNYQLVFLDNPGIYKKDNLLLTFKNFKEADPDLVLIITDRDCSKKEIELFEKFRLYNKNFFLVINKSDLLKKKILIDKIILSYLKHFHFDAVIPLSALKQKNLDILKENILNFIPKGPLYFPKHIVTNISEKDFIADLVREKILNYVHEEIPHICEIVVENIAPYKDYDLLEISVLIIVPKISQKKILIGAKGNKLKKIGIEAREDINKILKRKIFLNLWVKVVNK